MLNREIERDILPYCVENEISVVPYGPLAFGILGGNYAKDLKLDEGDWRKGIPLLQEGVYERNIDKVEALKKIAESKGITMADACILLAACAKRSRRHYSWRQETRTSEGKCRSE